MKRPVQILLVEDEPADAELITHALSLTQPPPRCVVVGSGAEALAHLAASPMPPQLVLLDINLPDMHGLELLQQIKRDRTLAALPVVILSSSDALPDIYQSYRDFASSYLVKPDDLGQLTHVMQALCDFWLRTARLAP
ncbi:response regulator [Deinococcus sonorensis]|uniref:Response regulator n=2 Tax=Deinococcus sonorensis TaxID=309891 RepID=A0AAU7U5B6_9DEIO